MELQDESVGKKVSHSKQNNKQNNRQTPLSKQKRLYPPYTETQSASVRLRPNGEYEITRIKPKGNTNQPTN